MQTNFTKKELRERLGLKNDAALAGFLKITPSAVYQWDEDGPVPENRVFQAFMRKPEAFPEISAHSANDASDAKQAVAHG